MPESVRRALGNSPSVGNANPNLSIDFGEGKISAEEVQVLITKTKVERV